MDAVHRLDVGGFGRYLLLYSLPSLRYSRARLERGLRDEIGGVQITFLCLTLLSELLIVKGLTVVHTARRSYRWLNR